MKATEKATEDNILGLASLRKEIEDQYDKKETVTPAPVKENPFWQKNYDARGHHYRGASLKQQFESVGDVFSKYERKLSGSLRGMAAQDSNLSQLEMCFPSTSRS